VEHNPELSAIKPGVKDTNDVGVPDEKFPPWNESAGGIVA
jgi:hypothetical protein